MLGINIAGVVGSGSGLHTAGSGPMIDSEEDALVAELEEPRHRKGSAQTRGSVNKRLKKTGSGNTRAVRGKQVNNFVSEK